MIYEIKGKQVMLDTDLPIIYKTETKRINEAVSRNSLKFPDRFCFKISEKEYNFLKSQFATSKGGASINKIGYKTFSITLINDNFILKTLLDRVCKIINS